MQLSKDSWSEVFASLQNADLLRWEPVSVVFTATMLPETLRICQASCRRFLKRDIIQKLLNVQHSRWRIAGSNR